MGHDTSTTNSDSGSAEAGAPGGIRGVGDGPPPATCALESRGLYRFRPVRAQEVPIVKDVNFTLPRGSFTTIMGPSGSGKSTLLHMLAGLDHSSAGEVWLGQDLMQGGDGASDAPSEERRTALRREHIGFIFQFFNLLPDLTVQENVALPLLVAGERPSRHAERIHHLLEVLGIEGLAGRRPMGLSGGEMQRVSIARALVTEPTLLLADEPTGQPLQQGWRRGYRTARTRS